MYNYSTGQLQQNKHAMIEGFNSNPKCTLKLILLYLGTSAPSIHQSLDPFKVLPDWGNSVATVTVMKLGPSITGVPAGGHYKVAVKEMDYCLFFLCSHLFVFLFFWLRNSGIWRWARYECDRAATASVLWCMSRHTTSWGAGRYYVRKGPCIWLCGCVRVSVWLRVSVCMHG